MTDKIVENQVQNTNNVTSDVPENGTLNILTEENKTEEKLFTQSQLEEILKDRLQRERRSNDALVSVKKLLKTACDKGLLSGTSYAEMAKDLVEKLSVSTNKACDTSDGEDKTIKTAQTPINAEIGGKTDVCHADGKENGEVSEKAQKKDVSFIAVLSDIKAKYPDAEVEKMLSGDGFERFAKGRSADIREIFDDYYDFMSAISEKHRTQERDTDHSELCSTAFSSHSGASDMGANLTKQQMDMAKSAGLSYREYAEMLESIPKRTGRTI